MARPLKDEAVPETRSRDTEQKRIWREKAKARYHSSEEVRLAKIAKVQRFRQENPEKVREAKRKSGLRRSRGMLRQYRKAAPSE